MSIRIDQPPCFPGETLAMHGLGLCVGRCRHDLLNGQCAWCKGLPDAPVLDEPSEDDTDAPVRWVHPEIRCQCVECDEWIGINGWCTWSAQGVLCRPCAEDAA